MEQPKNYPTLPTKQPENFPKNTTSIPHVVYPRIQWHNLFLTTKVINKYKDTHKRSNNGAKDIYKHEWNKE